MIVNVRDSTMVCLSEEVARHTVQISNNDLKSPSFYWPNLYFYRTNNTSNFFNAKIMKEALTKVFIPFNPMTGRLHWDKDGRVEIDCDSQGVLFVEADTNTVVDDLGDFTPPLQFCTYFLSLIICVESEHIPSLCCRRVSIFFNYLLPTPCVAYYYIFFLSLFLSYFLYFLMKLCRNMQYIMKKNSQKKFKFFNKT